MENGHQVETRNTAHFRHDYASDQMDLRRLYEQAKIDQWNAATDIDWSAKLDSDAKSSFTAAANDVKEKEKALHESMKAAEKADASSWADARTKLATDFQAYAQAVAQAEAAGQAGAKSGAMSKN